VDVECLNDDDILRLFNSSSMEWWHSQYMRYLQMCGYNNNGSILSALQPESLFQDVSEEFLMLERKKKQNIITDIIKIMDDYAVPNIRCPWGCCTFLEDIGGVSLHYFFDHVLSGFVWSKRRLRQSCNSMSVDRFEGMRPDFLYDNGSLLKMSSGNFVDAFDFVVTPMKVLFPKL